jgi:hypothetical protein
MKNIHILPTDKSSRLYLGNNGNFVFGMTQTSIQSKNDDFTNQNISITNSEEIKEGDWFITKGEVFKCTLSDEFIWRNNFDKFPSIKIECKKIILTTDQDLIKDGVQAIDDDFLEWFVKNPSCEEVEIDTIETLTGSFDAKGIKSNYVNVYKIIIPKEKTKQDTIEDKLKEYFNTTSKEQIQKDWEETCKQTEGIISPTVDEFIKAQEIFIKQETLEEIAERILANNIDGLRDALKDDDLFFFYKGVIQCYGQAMAKQDKQDEFAIGFSKWCLDIGIYNQFKKTQGINKELLEIYKKEKGL